MATRTITIDIEDEEREKMLKGVLRSLKFSFKVKKAGSTESPYDPEYVKKILKTNEQIKNNEFKKFNSAKDLKEYLQKKHGL